MKYRNFYFLLPYILVEWKIIFLIIIFALGFGVSTPLIAQLIGKISEIVSSGDLIKLLPWCINALLLFLLRFVFQLTQSLLTAHLSLKIIFNIRMFLLERVYRLGVDYFEKSRIGDLSHRVIGDVDCIGTIIHSIVQQFVPSLITVMILFFYMIYISLPLTLLCLVLSPLILLVIFWFGNYVRVESRKNQDSIGSLISYLNEFFLGIKIVKCFSIENYVLRILRKEAEKNRKASFRVSVSQGTQYSMVGFLESLSIMLLFIIGTWQIGENRLNPIEFISFGSAVALIIDPLNLISISYNTLKVSEASLERSFSLLLVDPNVKESDSAIVMPTIMGEVEYKNVCFGYDAEKIILRDISFRIEAGETIALVGHSGAGKSSIVNLLPRFYDPQEGEILIDGVNIKNYTLRSLRKQIGFVSQDVILFSGTIAENIALGESEIDWEKLIKVCHISNIHNFISRLPDGYTTRLGERGVNLSGGQRQRLAIARALYTDPRILVLDEATSALDSETEALVQEALEKAMHGRTVFIIAHRLSTIRQASRILVLERGCIIESGTHDELMSLSGRYRELYNRQII